MKIKKLTPDIYLEIVEKIGNIYLCYEHKKSTFDYGKFTKMDIYLRAYESSFIDSLEDVSLPNEDANRKIKINCLDIIGIVSDCTNISYDAMKYKIKMRDVSDARHLAMYFINEYTDLNHSDIAKLFNRDRSTVVTSIQKIKRMNCSHCPDIQLKCDTIQKAINDKLH